MTQSIEELRKKVDRIDENIIRLLSKRKGITKKIAEIKKGLAKPILDESREQQIIEKIKNRASELELDVNFIDLLYKLILENSKKEQEKIIKE